MKKPTGWQKQKANQRVVNYGAFVASRLKSGATIRAQLTGEQANLWHLATGVSGEAGELLDAIKKNCVYQKPLDVANVREELGDLEFYMEAMRQAVGVTREELLAENIAKLTMRFATGYTDAAAQERADKSTAPPKRMSKTLQPVGSGVVPTKVPALQSGLKFPQPRPHHD